MPPFIQYVLLASSIWRSRKLTNNGPNCKKLTDSLNRYLSTNNLILTNNGTTALQVALSSLSLPAGGEVITTPYSFVATSNAIIGASLKPVFVDIAQNSYNICPREIEKAITPKTIAILPVHVYGVPSNVEAIQAISRKYNLPVIYDAAHSFGVTIKGKSLLSYGDLSICSFHATKVFNTGEGGCIVPNSHADSSLYKLINFGFSSENDIDCFGINGKMSEFSAILGLLNLQFFGRTLDQRSRVFDTYLKYLNPLTIPPEILDMSCSTSVSWNFSYMPVMFDCESGSLKRDNAYTELKSLGIYARKYFYPLINETTAYSSFSHLWRKVGNLPISMRTSQITLCLPIYPGLTNNTIKKICSVINHSYENSLG